MNKSEKTILGSKSSSVGSFYFLNKVIFFGALKKQTIFTKNSNISFSGQIGLFLVSVLLNGFTVHN